MTCGSNSKGQEHGYQEGRKIAPHCGFIHVHDKGGKTGDGRDAGRRGAQNLAEFFRVFGDSNGSVFCMHSASRSYVVRYCKSLLGMGQSAIPTSFGS